MSQPNQVIKWLKSPEGRKIFEENFKQAEKFVQELQKKRKVSASDLRQEIII